ncbi:hypothetical protein [Xanthobacter wiegelii]|uniref:hypothetical protein n=1 Tax=Xanthobacter wiegelii TaxID=3119913 RepID=UPI003727354E
MDLRPLPNLEKIAARIYANRLNSIGVVLRRSPRRTVPMVLDLDALGTSPEWNADDLAPARSEAGK